MFVGTQTKSFMCFCTLLFITSIQCGKEQPITIKLINQNTNQNNGSGSESCLSCLGKYGEDLKNCMLCLETDEFKQTFLEISPHARLIFYTSLTPNELSQMLNRFESEEEWQEGFEELTDEQKKFLPETLAEQYKILQEAYMKHSPYIDDCAQRFERTALFPEYNCSIYNLAFCDHCRFEYGMKKLMVKYSRRRKDAA